MTPSSSDKNRIFTEIEERVRYSEIDQMGIAHNRVYFDWFELGRTEFCRKKKITYRDIEAQGYYLVVAESFCRFRKPLRYDERFLIRTSLDEMTPKRAVFYYELRSKKERTLIATGYSVHVVTDKNALICSLPKDIVEKLKS
jgi:acyl-CoA thioester hydrolase